MDAQETRIYTAAIIIVIIFGAVVLYFIISIVQQQHKNMALHKKLILAEIDAIEKDRARIAYDLHDELGSMLSFIKLKINDFDLTDEDDKIQMGKINEHLDKGLTRIREISYNLMPAVLINTGLAHALTDYINNNNQQKLTIGIIFPEEISFNEQQSINIYRIAQEIINNAIKHSKANRLDIVFTKRKNKIIISLKDNGTGFTRNQIKHKEGVGLRSLYSRAQLLNGKMFIESNPDAGTEFIFEIPC